MGCQDIGMRIFEFVAKTQFLHKILKLNSVEVRFYLTLEYHHLKKDGKPIRRRLLKYVRFIVFYPFYDFICTYLLSGSKHLLFVHYAKF